MLFAVPGSHGRLSAGDRVRERGDGAKQTADYYESDLFHAVWVLQLPQFEIIAGLRERRIRVVTLFGVGLHPLSKPVRCSHDDASE